jgi:hypothetical protein
MLNFQNAKIYKLVNSEDDEIYIGSTCGTLHLSKSRHKKHKNRQSHRKVYAHLNRIGWSNVRIILIEDFPCNNKNELLRREQHYIDTLHPSLNKNNAVYKKCPHGRRTDECIPCDGSGVCEHKRLKRRCVPCKGSQMCKHNRRKNQCVPCKESQICEHNRVKLRCVPCKVSQLCKQKKVKSSYKICNVEKYECDYCCKSYNSKNNLKYHYTSMKHKLKFISTFKKVFGEVISIDEAAEMDFL